jgi:hypothetical protein
VLGLLAEHPVRPAGVVTQLQQPFLQRGHVVTADRLGDHEGQRPVTQPVGGVAERTVRGRPDHAIGDQAALLLERPHGVLDRGVEDRRRLRVGRRQQAQRSECCPDLGNGRSGITAAEQLHAPLARLGRRFPRRGT